MNLVDVVHGANSTPMIGSMAVPVTPDVDRDLQNTPGDIVVGIRPEHLTVASEGLPGKVLVVEELGSEAYIHVDVEHQHDMLSLVVRAPGETEIDRGDNVHIAVNGPTHVFTADGRRLGD